jgi:hypothetical protein
LNTILENDENEDVNMSNVEETKKGTKQKNVNDNSIEEIMKVEKNFIDELNFNVLSNYDFF